MDNCIMVACDLHDKTMLLKIARGREAPQTCSVANTPQGRKKLVSMLKKQSEAANGAGVIFAYEASCQGFGLYDELTEAGFECHVLAPTRIARSVQHRRRKTDEKDAQRILELLRGYVLAGNELPAIWIPDLQTRDDREVIRMRLDVGQKITRLKAQIRCLLKRNNLSRPPGVGKGWTVPFRSWLSGLTKAKGPLQQGARAALASLLRQLQALEEEIVYLDEHVAALAWSPRYAESVAEMVYTLKGVGVLTAMVFLSEMGDLSRFSNRRQIGAYLGLVPSSNETGESNDRKGHITHHGSARVRKVLCQATWSRVRSDPEEKAAYQRIAARNPKHKKIAVVASMRRLAVRMWHRGLDVQSRVDKSSFPRHDEGVRWGSRKQPLADKSHQRPSATSAHPRPGYSSSGCAPAEPDSASPGRISLPQN